jgi:hypothetical protein
MDLQLICCGSREQPRQLRSFTPARFINRYRCPARSLQLIASAVRFVILTIRTVELGIRSGSITIPGCR